MNTWSEDWKIKQDQQNALLDSLVGKVVALAKDDQGEIVIWFGDGIGIRFAGEYDCVDVTFEKKP